MFQDVVIRGIGNHRGAPRLYLDMPEVARAEFLQGLTYKLSIDEASMRVTIHVDAEGDRVVSGKETRNGTCPLIDLSSHRVLGLFAGHQQVRVIFMRQRIVILPLASVIAQQERLHRLQGKLERGESLTVASFAHGAGIMAHAVHAGAKDAGIELQAAVVNEIDGDLMAVSRANNNTWRKSTRGLNMPMQELVQDPWVFDRLPRVEIFEAGIPCSANSRAGITKRKLSVPEAHPEVGHLIAPTVMAIKQMQPAIVLIENVTTMAQTGSAWILRWMLRDMGYSSTEVVLDSHGFGAVEGRQRWFLVAATNGLGIDLEGIEPKAVVRRTIAEHLDEVPEDDKRWRTFDYLKAKESRDRAEGKGFKMQIVTSTDTKVGCLRKGYHRGGSTDPLLQHPSDPNKLRLLTGDEHARCKQVPPELVSGRTDVEKHQMLGQGVAYEVVRALMRRVMECVKGAYVGGRQPTLDLLDARPGFSLKGVG